MKKVRPAVTLFLGSLLTCSALAQLRELPTPEEFEVIGDILSQIPVTSSERFNQVCEEILKEEGFTRSETGRWVHTDAAGRVVLTPFPNQGSFIMYFFPAAGGAIGDAALAALLDKAESLTVKGGETIELALPSRRLEQGEHVGETWESLTFTLNGGIWVRTSRTIRWQ